MDHPGTRLSARGSKEEYSAPGCGQIALKNQAIYRCSLQLRSKTGEWAVSNNGRYVRRIGSLWGSLRGIAVMRNLGVSERGIARCAQRWPVAGREKHPARLTDLGHGLPASLGARVLGSVPGALGIGARLALLGDEAGPAAVRSVCRSDSTSSGPSHALGFRCTNSAEGRPQKSESSSLLAQ
jgi:hypothetical protein